MFKHQELYEETARQLEHCNYLVHMDVVIVVTVIYGFDETFELPYGTAVDHQNKSHPDWVLHLRQAVFQLTNGLN